MQEKLEKEVCYLFQLLKLRKIHGKKSVKQIGKKHLMNSLFRKDLDETHQYLHGISPFLPFHDHGPGSICNHDNT